MTATMSWKQGRSNDNDKEALRAGTEREHVTGAGDGWSSEEKRSI